MGLLRKDGGDVRVDDKVRKPKSQGRVAPLSQTMLYLNMKKDCLFLLVLVLLLIPLTNSTAESDTPEIILEDGYFYVVPPNGEKITIVKEHEPWVMNKAKLSPDGQYVVYTTANGLGFESGGRDLFYCKADGTQRTFLHKFELYISDWVWLSKDDRDFLIALSWEGKAWVLDLNKKKLLLSFHADSVKKIEGTECYETFGIRVNERKEKRVCADELVRISKHETPKPQVLINWMGDLVYLSAEEASVFGYDEILKCFAPVYDMLSAQERTPYREIRKKFTHRTAFFAQEATSLAKNTISFSISGMSGRFDLKKRKVEFLDIGGILSLKVFCSPQGRHMVILKTEPAVAQKLVILRKTGEDSWKNMLTKEFSLDASISNLEWSKQDETRIYYSVKEGDISKDSCVIDLTAGAKK